MGQKLGFEGKLYYNTGSYASPTWTLINNVGDLEMPDEMDEADMTNRASGGFEMVLPSIRKLGLDFDAKANESDTVLTALRTAYAARTIKEYAIANDAIATVGTVYMRMSMYLMKFPWSQKLREGQMFTISLKPGYSSDANPALVTVSA